MGQTIKQKRIQKMRKIQKIWVKANKLAIARTKDRTGEVVKQN